MDEDFEEYLQTQCGTDRATYDSLSPRTQAIYQQGYLLHLQESRSVPACSVSIGVLALLLACLIYAWIMRGGS